MICAIAIIFVKKKGGWGALQFFLFHNSATTYFALAIKSLSWRTLSKGEKKPMRAKYKEEERSK